MEITTKRRRSSADIEPPATEDAHAASTRGAVADVAASLQELLGQKLTAVIAGVADASAVGNWARGDRRPHPKAEERLRDAFRVATVLAKTESTQTVRAWFIGMNPELDDHPPALVIADDPTRVMRAARAFVAHG